MTTIARTFEIDKDILQDVDKILPVEMQAKYINEYFAKMIAQRKQNQAEIEDIIWNFATNPVDNTQPKSEDILREIRDKDYNV